MVRQTKFELITTIIAFAVATGFSHDKAAKCIRVPSLEGDATAAIQGAIDQAFTGGGGTVVVGKGEWRVKALRVRSRVTLRLEAGATILGSRNPDDYFILDDDKVEPVPREWITHEACTSTAATV